METPLIQTAQKWKFSLGSIEDFKSLCKELNAPVDIIEDTSILAESVKVGNWIIPNSLAIHPMEGCDGDSEGRPGPLTLRRYRRFSAGGAGLIWAEAIAVVPEGRANPRQLWLNEKSKDSFAEMVGVIRKAAAESVGLQHRPVIVAQLTHSGRYSKPRGFAEPLVPQRDPYRDSLVPQARPDFNFKSQIAENYPLITDEYLDNLQDAYVDGAGMAFQAGFDAVDIKSCHGYLINELLAGRNRSGKYGGSFENRTRFLLEVIGKIHDKLGENKPIFVRLGFYDAIPYPFGWGVDKNDYTKPDLTEPRKLLNLLLQRGVKVINFTCANPYYNPHIGRPFNQPIKGGYGEPEHPLLGVKRLIDLAGQIQTEFPQIAIVGTGYSWLRHLMGNVAAATKSNGKAKIIGVGRMAFAYPDFAKDLLRKGKLEPSKVCVGCSACTQMMRDDVMTGCVVRDNKIYGPIFRRGRMSNKENLARLASNCLQCQEPTCRLACPARIDIPGFIQQFLEGDEKGAYETIREANILPEICAWLCPVEQQCQGGCLQRFIGDGALPIADIQRYLAKQANRQGWSKLRIPEKATDKKVAIAGAGPAGLACAAKLIEYGHSVTIFDKSRNIGGMIEYTIPLDRQNSSLQNEISAVFKDVPKDRLILRPGIKLSEGYNLDEIMTEGFNAVFLAVGLPEAIYNLDEKIEGLYDALQFLSLAKNNSKFSVAKKQVAVIGGGNTAMDAAITANRLGASDVYVIYRRSFAEMPAWVKERDRALNEGVHFLILTQRLSYISEKGRLTGITLCPTRLTDADTSGRRVPELLKLSKYNLSMDIVVEAMGQKVPQNMDKILPGIHIDKGLVKVNENSFETSRRGVFAGGDLIRGPSTVVEAVADGMAAAKEINNYLQKKQ
jgi:2,4-dienoyl-CoA reductase (NADPH2)